MYGASHSLDAYNTEPSKDPDKKVQEGCYIKKCTLLLQSLVSIGLDIQANRVFSASGGIGQVLARERLKGRLYTHVMAHLRHDSGSKVLNLNIRCSRETSSWTGQGMVCCE